ncbi:hypothetical protein ADIAL_1296 [Alkalibacterium sp. AK22]|nr:hypothetical protein ADIAL_1296 [Alkalibacterium sp. AK22]
MKLGNVKPILPSIPAVMVVGLVACMEWIVCELDVAAIWGLSELALTLKAAGPAAFSTRMEARQSVLNFFDDLVTIDSLLCLGKVGLQMDK